MDTREMEVADAAGLLPLLDVVGWGSPQDEVEVRLQRIADHPDYTGWVAVDGGRVVGFATGQLNWMVQASRPWPSWPVSPCCPRPKAWASAAD